jgi:activator of 2-hydroxyglutaryl-CoA dehydratase/predicted nucleotide-binding protein (sugar kinase/HSP70/actin superfamily)
MNATGCNGFAPAREAGAGFQKIVSSRFVGIDAGAETVKLVELVRDRNNLRIERSEILEHGKNPGPVLREALRRWDWANVDGAAVSGRFSSQINLSRIPTKQAQLRGYQFLFGDEPATIVNIGSHGFTVLEVRGNGLTVFRENSRCSQGTGNFLRQLVERFSLTVEQASVLCADVPNPAPLSGRCPVILKTDMTHLANKGEDRARILAGLFDAVCENVMVLVKPGASPPRVLLTGGVSRSPRVRRVFGKLLAKQNMSLIATDENQALCLEAIGCALIASENSDELSVARPIRREVLDCGSPLPLLERMSAIEQRQRAAAVQDAGATAIAPDDFKSSSLPALEKLLLPPRELKLERLPSLADALGKVRRMPAQPWAAVNGEFRRLVLGFDIGSTGSKLVAMDAATRETVWDGYRQTLGDPVGAAQDLLRRFTESPAAKYPVVAFGTTGSGREITGSLLTSCYGKDAVFIVNEIVAHATGALHYDLRVDTIFEIGGQDAKYIRLAEGRIIDCAMNEACSAGTGSFIEEQGRKFTGIGDVRQLGQAAMAAPCGVSLGQHCSVFMAEVIDEAVAAGVEQPAIISGLYDSIIKNYLNRVKGDRSVGKVIFCQGMPFSADALATAVARQTGSQVVVPPNPGTVGALGIAMLAARELAGRVTPCAPSPAEPLPGAHGVTRPTLSLDLSRFLNAKVEQKDTFVCGSNRGCGGAGNRCRIERLRTLVNSQRSIFTWGGGCSLHDKGTRKKKLPDLAPDPFREREELVQKLIADFSPCSERRPPARHDADMPDTQRAGPEAGAPFKPRIAMSDEFMLKGLFPFFAAFFHHAGFDLEILNGAGPDLLKRGIQLANAPFCAPMQHFHGVAEKLACRAVASERRPAGGNADWLFMPMLRSTPLAAGQRWSVVCPIAQGAPKLLASILQRERDRSADSHVRANTPLGLGTRGHGCPRSESARFLSPIIDCAEGNLKSPEFLASCERLAKELKLSDARWREAWRAGVEVQKQFDSGCREIGRRALEFCRAHNIVPVVVLGRAYTIYNRILNSNVPAILREQGAIGIPLDCYPLDADTPVFTDMYWGYGQNILRAAHQVRRATGVYALYCSNYSCGPDSFNLHFAAYVMEGKPFAVIETDGHSGDAGTRTRVEAFLHCVEEDRRGSRRETAQNNFKTMQFSGLILRDLQKHNGASERLLIPYIGPASETVARVFQGLGLAAEALSVPDAESLRIGRRYTSGKECLPMPLTLGSLLQRLARAKDGERFAYLMPSTNGPCRFGVYNLLNNIVLERLGWRDRVRIWSPKDSGYFDHMPAGTEMLIFAGIVASDLLFQAQLDVRPLEGEHGGAEEIYQRYRQKLLSRMESAARGNLSLGPALWQVAGGNLFGVRELLKRAGVEFAAMRGPGELPLVELAGEIYVRAVEFSNACLIQKLEARGLRVHLAPKTEWLNYCGYLQQRELGRNHLADNFSALVKRRIESAAFAAIGPRLGWTPAPRTEEVLSAAEQYVSDALAGEAVLTVGAPLLEWRHRKIDAVVNVGPLECMPSKIAQAQLHHIAEREGLLSLSLPLNGDPVSEAALDNFAFEVHARFQKRNERQVTRDKISGSARRAQFVSPATRHLSPAKGFIEPADVRRNFFN